MIRSAQIQGRSIRPALPKSKLASTDSKTTTIAIDRMVKLLWVKQEQRTLIDQNCQVDLSK
jgi:hypothetical protein